MKPSMSLQRLLALVLAAALCTSACSSLQGEVDEGAGISLVKPEPDMTPIEPSANVRIGKLDNGLTYYVRTNSSPADGVSLRLAVNAGSLQQEVPDSGSAHFLEHMLFNGTEKYPGNELTQALERLGVEFGADSNAYTGADETVYQLDIPDADEAKVDTALEILSEWASAATITERDTFQERGVVREEARLFLEGSQERLRNTFLEQFSVGTDYEGRAPIGTQEKILETTAPQLREFYDRWYRPDLMAVIAVGDMPADQLEAKIKEQFGSLKSRGDNKERTEAVAELNTEPQFTVVVDAGLPEPVAELTYRIDPWVDATVGGERLNMLQMLYGMMIMNRLTEDAENGEAGLVKPVAYTSPLYREQMMLTITYSGADIATATSRVAAQLGHIARNGFSDAEAEQAVAEMQASFDETLASSSSTESSLFGDEYVDNFFTGSEISEFDDAHARISTFLSTVTADKVSDMFRWDQARAAPIMLVGSPNEETAPTESELQEAFNAGMDLIIERADDRIQIEELMAPPSAVKPTSSNPIEGYDGTQLVFENGLTVNFAKNTTEAGTVRLSSISPGGFSTLDSDDAPLMNEVIHAATISGVADFARSDYRRYLSRSSAMLSPFQLETMHGFDGQSSTDDFEILLQQMHLMITAPRVDELALNEAKLEAETVRASFGSNASNAAINELQNILYRDDERFSYMPSESVNDLTDEKALALFKTLFGGVDGMTIGIAGDIDEERVVELASQYLGTLPAGEAVEATNSRPAPLTKGEKRQIEVVSSEEAAGAVAVMYEAPVSTSDAAVETLVTLRVIDTILNDRLLVNARERLGATYGGSVSSTPADEPINTVSVMFHSTGDPERLDEIREIMIDSAESLAAKGATADEFDRAIAIVTADLTAEQSSGDLAYILTDPDLITPEIVAKVLAQLESSDVQEMAKTLFDQPVRAEVLARS